MPNLGLNENESGLCFRVERPKAMAGSRDQGRRFRRGQVSTVLYGVVYLESRDLHVGCIDRDRSGHLPASRYILCWNAGTWSNVQTGFDMSMSGLITSKLAIGTSGSGTLGESLGVGRQRGPWLKEGVREQNEMVESWSTRSTVHQDIDVLRTVLTPNRLRFPRYPS